MIGACTLLAPVAKAAAAAPVSAATIALEVLMLGLALLSGLALALLLLSIPRLRRAVLRGLRAALSAWRRMRGDALPLCWRVDPAPRLLLSAGDERILDANRAAQEAYRHTRAELRGVRLSDLDAGALPEADAQRVADLLSRLGRSAGFELRLHRSAGRGAMPVALLRTPLQVGRVRRVLMAVEPLHSMLELARAQANTAQRLDELLHGGGIGLWELDLDTGRLHAGEGVSAQFGALGGGFPSTYDDLLEWVAPQDRQALAVALQRAVEGRDRADVECALAEGQRYVRIESLPRRAEHDGPRLSGRITDISALKRMEIGLRESEERFRGIVDGLPDALILADAGGVVRYANEVALSLWGAAQPAALIGHALGDMLDCEPLDEEEDADEPGNPFQRRRCLLSDGSHFIAPVALRSVQLQSGDGQLVVVRAHERSQRLAERLREANQRLRQLSSRLLSLQERERRKLARDLHDEIGQALTAILLHVDLLARKTEDATLLQRIAKVREIVEAGVQQVRGMLHELRPPQLEELGLAAAIRAQLERIEAADGLRIECECPPLVPRPDPRIEAVAYRLVQEGVTNAVKHAQARHLRVRLGVDRAAGELGVEVIDDGQGFDPAHAGRVASGGGSGLGLAGMRERLSLVGGELDIQSARGLGTRLSARLPLSPPEDEGEHEAA